MDSAELQVFMMSAVIGAGLVVWLFDLVPPSPDVRRCEGQHCRRLVFNWRGLWRSVCRRCLREGRLLR